MVFHLCEFYIFSLLWNFIPYSLLFQGIKNFTAVLRSSQNGGDPEKSCNWPQGERYVILVQDTGFHKNLILQESRFLSCSVCSVCPCSSLVYMQCVYLTWTVL